MLWFVTGGRRAIGKGIGGGLGPAPAARFARLRRVVGEGLIGVARVGRVGPHG